MADAARLHFDAYLSGARNGYVALDQLKRAIGFGDLDHSHTGHRSLLQRPTAHINAAAAKADRPIGFIMPSAAFPCQCSVSLCKLKYNVTHREYNEQNDGFDFRGADRGAKQSGGTFRRGG
jgi:hypothetical protein